MTQQVVERREYTRVKVEIEAVLAGPAGTNHAGTVRDISFAGAYLDCGQPPAVTDTAPIRGCVLSLVTGGDSEPIRLRCTVVDVQGERVGLRFTGADEPDYHRLRDYLVNKSDDPETLIREIREMPNPAFAAPLPRFASWLSQLVMRT